MKGISWIEFLISFVIFLSIFYFLFMSLQNIKIELISDKDYINKFQEFFLASYYYLETKNYSGLRDIFYMLNADFRNYSFPSILILNNSKTTCYNCITLYYNYENNSITLLQRVSSQYNSYLDLYLVVLNNSIKVISTNADVDCNDYLSLGENMVEECSLKLVGNSTITFYPVKNYVYIRAIDTFANFYIYNTTIKTSRAAFSAMISGEPFTFYVDKPGVVIKKIFIVS